MSFLGIHWPWSRDDGNDTSSADEAVAQAEAKLEDAYIRWPEVMGLKIEIAREKQVNHFAERWEREMRLRASGNSS
jgi:hypothetical protein